MNQIANRPILKAPLTIIDRIIDGIGWVILVAVWYLTITHYHSLPETIPIHFNAAGKADGFGGKITILMLPIVATILFVGMTVLNRFPQVFNYPTEITEENATRQYTNATRIIRYIKTVIVIVFGSIVYMTIQNATGKADGLGAWFLPVTLGLIFIPVIYFVLKAYRS